jgi:hypothetical protein
MGLSLLASAAFDAGGDALIMASRYAPRRPGRSCQSLNTNMVYLPSRVPAGWRWRWKSTEGAAASAKLPGKDKITVPVESPSLEPPKKPRRAESTEQLVLPAKTSRPRRIRQWASSIRA